MLTCEACKSENIQKLSLVYEIGLSQVKGKQSGVGFGLGGDGGVVGVGTTKYSGTNQTLASKNAAPPVKKKPMKVGLFYLLAAWSVFQFAPGNLGIVLILLAGCGVHVFANIRYNQRIYPTLFQKWNGAFLCLKCGSISVPSIAEANLPSG